MLSQEQRELVKNNMNLVYTVAGHMNILGNLDAIQEGFIGLCKAAENYDKNKAKFSTFAYSYVKGYMHTFLRKDFVIKPLRDKKNNLKFCAVEEYVEDTHAIKDPKDIDNLVQIKQIMDRVDNLTKHVLKLYYEGYTQQEIGEKLKLSQTTVCRKIKNISKEIL